MENTANKNFEELCNECPTIVEESDLTEEDIDRIVAKSKETQRKAEKYDLLVEKLKKDILNITKIMQDGKHYDDYSRCRLKAYRTKTKEILSFMKEEN